MPKKSTTKFALEYPYSQDWSFGKIVINPEGRRNVLLYDSKKENGKNSTVSYARYLMAVHLGRYLNKEEQVDHINGNRLDDYIENLQILTRKENNLKTAIERGATKVIVDLKCPGCGITFSKAYNQTHYVKGGNYTSCSRTCSGKIGHLFSKEEIVEIGEKQILKKYRKVHAFDKKLNVEHGANNSPEAENSILNSREGLCTKCGVALKWRGTTGLCAHCSNTSPKPSSRKVERPSKVELLRNLESGMSWVAMGKKYGVSDNAVRKWVKYYGVNY